MTIVYVKMWLPFEKLSYIVQAHTNGTFELTKLPIRFGAKFSHHLNGNTFQINTTQNHRTSDIWYNDFIVFTGIPNTGHQINLKNNIEAKKIAMRVTKSTWTGGSREKATGWQVRCEQSK